MKFCFRCGNQLMEEAVIFPKSYQRCASCIQSCGLVFLQHHWWCLNRFGSRNRCLDPQHEADPNDEAQWSGFRTKA